MVSIHILFYLWMIFFLLDGSNDEGDDKQDTEDEAQQRRSYSLREHKPRTQLYIAPAIGETATCYDSWCIHIFSWKGKCL